MKTKLSELVYRIIRRCLSSFSQSILLNGVVLKIPIMNGVRCNVTEQWMVEILDSLLKESEGAFIDVGVNLGQTLIKVKAIDENINYVGFEPNPSCLSYLYKLIDVNEFKNCTIFPVGLYTENKLLALNFFSDDPVDSSASLINGYRSVSSVKKDIFVPVLSFESISGSFMFNAVSIIKIDVEGAELEVLTSLVDVIENFRPLILLEILPVYDEKNSSRINRQEKIEMIFGALKYVFYRISKDDGRFSSLIKIDSIGIHSNLSDCDYLISPEERLINL